MNFKLKTIILCTPSFWHATSLLSIKLWPIFPERNWSGSTPGPMFPEKEMKQAVQHQWVMYLDDLSFSDETSLSSSTIMPVNNKYEKETSLNILIKYFSFWQREKNNKKQKHVISRTTGHKTYACLFYSDTFITI